MKYRFCPVCGGRLKKETAVLQVCSACGFHLYDNPKFSVNIILENEKGEILFAKRNRDPGKGTWNTPGGMIDPGESAEAAARREVLEETGLKVKDLAYTGSYPDTYRFRDIEHHLLAFSFAGRVPKGKLRPGDDAAELKFFAKKGIPWRNMGIPSDAAALRDYLKRKNVV